MTVSSVRPQLLLMALLAAFLVTTVIWASVAEVEIAAAAPGRIVPVGLVKTVKPFQQGKMKRIAVEEGSVVDAGDVLIEFDTTLVDADLAKLTAELAIKSVEAARLEALLGWRRREAFNPPSGAPPEIVAINERLVADQLESHRARLHELDGRIAERRAQIGTLGAKVEALEKLLPILRERTEMHDALYTTKHGSRIRLLDERQKLIELEGDVHHGNREIAQAKASLAALLAQKKRTVAEHFRERRSELAAVRGRMIVLRQDIRQARERRARHTLVSPVAGIVQDLAVHTRDGVVEPGTQIMVIVPRDTGLRVEAFVSNDDVGFVRPGQRATLKIATFDFRRYGTIEGTVTNVARDAVTVGAPDASAAAGGPSGPLALQDQTAGSVEGPAFRILIDLDRTHLEIENETIALSPGMAVEAAIVLGRQRVIEYVLHPLRGYRQDAFREK